MTRLKSEDKERKMNHLHVINELMAFVSPCMSNFCFFFLSDPTISKHTNGEILRGLGRYFENRASATQ